MADRVATVSLNMSYAGPGGQSVTVPAITTLPTYPASCAGTIDVPAGATKDTEIVVPFGTIATGVTCCAIKNNAGQELGIVLNDADDPSFNLASGGVLMLASVSLPDGDPLTKMEVKLPAEQVTAGTVDYWVFGDPEPEA